MFAFICSAITLAANLVCSQSFYVGYVAQGYSLEDWFNFAHMEREKNPSDIDNSLTVCLLVCGSYNVYFSLKWNNSRYSHSLYDVLFSPRQQICFFSQHSILLWITLKIEFFNKLQSHTFFRYLVWITEWIKVSGGFIYLFFILLYYFFSGRTNHSDKISFSQSAP